MLSENKIIPYSASVITGKRVLVLAPHPDDETLGCGGSLALHIQARDPVKVVFLTNGAQGDASLGMEKSAYVALRQQEAIAACACLGVDDIQFWPIEDRSLAGSRGALNRMLDLLEEFQPERVYVPSPLEFHPDHRAAAFLLCDAIAGCDFDFEVAFYEICQPLCVNLLVDISGVLDRKQEAIQKYQSQLQERPYGDYSLSLNRYRSMTLPPEITHAEGFSVWNVGILKKLGPLGISLRETARLLPTVAETGPLVSIIVRTKDRPRMLARALKSIVDQTYTNLEIVVVNDGGTNVRDVVEAHTRSCPVRYIPHNHNRGRSAAANSGMEGARGVFLNFLDDDDIFYPQHLETLVTRAVGKNYPVVYSKALRVYFDGDPDRLETRENEELVFNQHFNPDLLLLENYIPSMSVLFSKDVYRQIGGFCEDLVRFGDWDFWIRVSRHYPFQHVDQVTAEYRFYDVSAAEESHPEKCSIEEARSALFDRVRPLLTGRAWNEYLTKGKGTQLRGDANSLSRKIAQLQKNPASSQSHIWQLEDTFQNCGELEGRLSACQAHAQRLEAEVKNNEASVIQKDDELNQVRQQCAALTREYRDALDRIHRHWAYRAYRALKNPLNFKR